MAITAADLVVKMSADTKDAERGMQRMSRGISGFAKSAAQVGVGILGAAAFGVIGRGFAGATAGALDFGKQMANVNSLVGLSDGAFQKLNDQVLALTADPRIAQAPATLAAGLYDIYSSGFQGADGLQVLEQSALAATAGVTDTATAARVITANLNAFGLEASDSQRVSDVLFQTVADGVITFEQLANNMGNVIPIANSLKLSVEDVGAAYAVMTLKGVPASQAETQIAALMRSAVNPTEALTTAVQAHGYATASAAIESEGFAGFLDIVNDAAGGNQETMFDLLGTQEAYNAATILGADHGKDYRGELDKMNKSSKGLGATNKALEQQMKSSSFQIAKMKQQVSTLATVGFGILAPVIGRVAGAMTGFLSRTLIPFTSIIGRATRANFTFGKGFDKLLAGIPQPLRRSVHAIASLTDALSDMWRHGFSKNEMTQAGHALQAIGEELGQAVSWAANIAIDLVTSFSGWLWDHAGDIWGGIKSLVGWGAGKFSDAITATISGTIALGGDLADAAGHLWDWIRAELFGVGGSISQDPASPMYGQQQPIDIGVIDVLAKVGSIVADYSQNLITNLSAAIANYLYQHKVELKSLGVNVDDIIPILADTAQGDFQKAVADALTKDPIKVTPEMEVNIHDAVENWVRDQAGKPIDLSGVMSVAQWAALIPGLFTNIPAAITSYFIGKGGTDIGVALRGAIGGALAGAFTSQQVFERPGYPGTYTQPGYFTGWMDTIQTALVGAASTFKPDLSGITSAIGAAWTETLSLFTVAFDPDFGFIGDAIGDALDAITWPTWAPDFSWITGPIADLKGYIQDLLGLKQQASDALGGASAQGRGTGHEQAGPYAGYPISGIPQAAPPPIPLKFVGDNQSVTDTIAGATKTATDHFADHPFKATFDADTGPMSQAYTKVFGWGQTFAKQDFKATLSADNGPMAVAYTAAFGWGNTFDAQDFQATLSADNGPAAVAYTTAFGWGYTWAAQTFTARFAIDTSGLWNALAVAQTVAANISAIMPHSPAKKGPLSKPISFGFIADAARRDLSGLGSSIEGYLGMGGHRRPLAHAGTHTGPRHITVNVHGSSDAGATGRAVVKELRAAGF